MSVLYSKNVFFFDQNRDEDHMKFRKFVSAVPACLAFVHDQAPYALHLIKKIKIKFGSGNRVCRQETSLEDVTRLWSLCKVFGSLEHLSIIFRGWPVDKLKKHFPYDQKLCLSLRGLKRFFLELWAVEKGHDFHPDHQAAGLAAFAATTTAIESPI
ncbi:uncharacterized protein BKA78DRAFT_297529 [Phyllosticta capitalensis]